MEAQWLKDPNEVWLGFKKPTGRTRGKAQRAITELDWKAYYPGSRMGNRKRLLFVCQSPKVNTWACPTCPWERAALVAAGTPPDLWFELGRARRGYTHTQTVAHVAHHYGIKTSTLRRALHDELAIREMREKIFD